MHKISEVHESIISERDVIEGVPVITYRPASGQRLPVVFFLHGFGGSKDDGRAIGALLAQAGIRAVCVDLYMHGDHRDPVPFPGMFPIVQHTVDDLRRLIARFREDAQDRIGVVGVSMGALVTFYLAANEPAVQTAVSLIGNPDFEANFQHLTEIDKDLKWISLNNKPLWDAMIAMGKAMNPKERLDAFHPRPLLMINGRHDPFVDPKHSLELYERLRPLYVDHPERLQSMVFDVAHEVTPEMNETVVHWFSHHLKVTTEEE